MTGNIDKAVQAAAKHSYEYEGDRKGILYVGWEYEGEEVREQWRSSVRQVLTAALPHLPLGFDVKQLEWVDYYATTECGTYTVGDDDHGWFFTFHEYPYGEADEARFDLIEEALAAAAPYLTASVEVEELKWFQTDDKGDWWGAETGLSECGQGDYSICKEDGYYFCVGNEPMIKSKGDENWPTVEEAKASAQADYTKRVLSALKSKHVDVAAVRRQALEEAKAIAFDTSENGQYMGNGDCGENSIYQQGAREVYGAICDHIESAPSAEPAQGDHIASVSNMVEADKWQDIATAPKDGTWVLAFYRQGCVPAIIFYDVATSRWLGEDIGTNTFTHWMPLPAAPTSKRGE